MDEVAFARQLRRRQTDAELSLWAASRDRRFLGLKFRRQVPCGRYVLDFYCHALRLVVELDGGQHLESAHDRERDVWLAGQGRGFAFCAIGITMSWWGLMLCWKRFDWRSNPVRDDYPHPQPSPRGRGGCPLPVGKLAYVLL